MEDLQSKLGAVFGNPEMMSQIMNMAQQLGGTPAPPPAQTQTSLPEGLDIEMLTKLAGVANSANIDQNQQFLLQALRPYLTSQRIEKLGKAMRAAKLADMASGLLGSGILTRGG